MTTPQPRAPQPRAPLRRTAETRDADDEFFALYGPWDPLSPAGLARELAGFGRGHGG